MPGIVVDQHHGQAGCVKCNKLTCGKIFLQRPLALIPVRV
jgi:hypothetical protein